MSIFALQSPAGGFLDEELRRFNKLFDDWCVQFESLEDAELVANSLAGKLDDSELTAILNEAR